MITVRTVIPELTYEVNDSGKNGLIEAFIDPDVEVIQFEQGVEIIYLSRRHIVSIEVYD